MQLTFTDWVSAASPVDVHPFTQPTGLAVQTTGDPSDLFALFFTPEIIQSIVVETNRYAALHLRGTSAYGQQMNRSFGRILDCTCTWA